VASTHAGDDGTDHGGGNDEYLSAGDAARLLCVSPRTVSRWADQGRIPHLVTLGGHRRFSRARVLELSRKGRRQGDGSPSSWM